MREEKRIDYIEIPTTDLVETSTFFGEFFGWSFQEWGPDYSSFNDGRMDGGLRRATEATPLETGVLIVFYSTDLERDRDRAKELGATISQDIFDFPGGRRFHFVDPTGAEFAIWASVE